MDHVKAWLDRHLPVAAPKTLLGKAIRYTLRFWSRLTQFLGDGQVPLSNNRTEQAIKKVVIGRKNFLFAYSPAGARTGEFVRLGGDCPGQWLGPMDLFDPELHSIAANHHGESG